MFAMMQDCIRIRAESARMVDGIIREDYLPLDSLAVRADVNVRSIRIVEMCVMIEPLFSCDRINKSGRDGFHIGADQSGI